jgi:2-haloacid dehalogenase
LTPLSEIDFTRFDAVTFDCYGTLIDWEQGILNALQPVLAPHGIDASEDELLESYARHEAALEAGDYLPYRDVLAGSLCGLCEELGFSPSDHDANGFSQAVGDWPAFHDTAVALHRLSHRFRLGVITNCDKDLFALSNRRLGVTFDWIVTAEDARSYKPSLTPFEVAFATIDVPRDRIVHVAQSLYHDHVAAKQLGLTTVWVDRRHDRPGFGATPEASATPNLTVPDMRTFADVALDE